MGIPPETRLSEWLKTALAAEHDALEATEFARAMTGLRLPLEAYVGMLKALSVAHAVFERAIMSVSNASVAQVWDPSWSRLSALEADLEHFGRLEFPEPRVAIDAALALGDRVLKRTVEDPESLVGAIYVFAGAAAGQVATASGIAETFGLDGPGLAYMSAFGPATSPRLAELKRRIDALELDAMPGRDDTDVRERMRNSAVEVYRAFGAIFRALLPLPDDDPYTAVSLNPEAGRHPIPRDPREIGAAALAGRISWDEYPYFERRFGERGRRFTKSDGAWLATLCDLEQPQLESQVEWLTRVLAARGMPSFLMERHLRNLHHQLVAANPAGAPRYRGLLVAADRIAAERGALLDETHFADLSSAFDERVRALDLDLVPRSGRLVVAAVVDEAVGRPRAVESLLEWLADPRRFDHRWVAAVESAVARARAALSAAGAGD
jgi:hypothetical protein